MEKTRKFSWSKYFSNEDYVSYIRKGTAFYNTTGSSNFYVFSCLFENCTGDGAIHIVRDNEICTLLECSVFNNCSSTSFFSCGSVCFFCQEEGQLVQERTFYYQSIAEGYLAFVQFVKNSPSNKNYAFDVSVFNCGESETKGSDNFGIVYGDLLISKINSTNNKCARYVSILSGVNGLGTCNFSTFKENNQSRHASLAFISDSGTSSSYTVSYCNIIGNICGTDYDLEYLFHCECLCNVDHCIFLNNTASFMFNCRNLTISDSYVDVNTTDGNVIYVNLTENYDFNNFTYFDKETCVIEPKEITIEISYLSKFVKSVSPSLLSSK